MSLGHISTLTIGLLSAFVFVIIFFVNFFGGIDAGIGPILIFIVGCNLILWLVSPSISGIMYRWLYKVSWITIDDIDFNNCENIKNKLN